MNTKPSEFKSYAMTVAVKTLGTKNDVVVCPPFTHLSLANEIFSGSHIDFGAQNISEENSGAYTGQISAQMIKDLNAGYVILGHLECREKFNENDKMINKKLKIALANGLRVLLCVGEDLATKESQKDFNFVNNQLAGALRGIYENELESVFVVYEPQWTHGKEVTTKDIDNMADNIRKQVAFLYSEKSGQNLNVLYGGNVTAGNYKKILSSGKVNGVLIGSASLNVEDFVAMAKENY